MNRFAFKCTKCGTIDYSNTLRRVYMVCPKCATRMIRSVKNDRRQN